MTTTLTRRRRRRETRRGVVVAERAARYLITGGGIGTIVAVTLIFFFLLWVVVPLFLPPVVDGEQHATSGDFAAALAVRTDDEKQLAWLVRPDGTIATHLVATGVLVGESRPFESFGAPTAASFTIQGSPAMFGFADGTIRPATIGFTADFPKESELDEASRSLGVGESRPIDGGLAVRTPEGQVRATTLAVELDEPFETGVASAVVALDHSVTPSGLAFAALFSSGDLRVYKVRERTNLLTGEVERKVTETSVALDRAHGRLPLALALAGLGEDLYLAWPSGELLHIDLRDFGTPRLMEAIDLVEDHDAQLTSLEYMLGKSTLVAGDSLGRVRAWFPVRDEEVQSDVRLTLAHSLQGPASPVVALAPSPRSRLLAAAFADGTIDLYHVTSRVRLLRMHSDAPPKQLVMTPKEDGLLAVHDDALSVWSIDARYPEANLASLFGPVWYEGYPGPEHVWQSAGGTDEFEPKLGLVPLVFGTIKATLYSMAIGAPLALLAAIFTSEFLSPRLRGPIKATIELMASLPSVVLGFLAALVIAPFVQGVVPGVLAFLFAMPLALLAGAYLWQLLPAGVSVRLHGWPRFVFIAVCLPLAILIASGLGPLLEHLLFAGDIKLWLDGRLGNATGGWFLLLVPVSALVVVFVSARFVKPILRRRAVSWERPHMARFDLGRFLVAFVVALAVAGVGAVLLSAVGFDPRDSVLGTYVPRNAMIVGFVMGFAIIPIIYTLAEDALSEVPGHLREASLGAGATPWQTAMRVVIPTATSGLFSALMIGLGRAVGETMIVLMAVGNTAIMDWNVFNGFRTLSANIAVELPEAVRNSTHYRTLFLAALVLFAMTFLLNTVAEIVRRHFRKKTHAL